MRNRTAAALCLLILLASPLCAAEKVLEIKERVFVSLINEIYINADDYIGSDLNPGFEVIWNGKYPASGVWVDATGILEVYEKEYLRLRLTELKLLPANKKMKLYVQ